MYKTNLRLTALALTLGVMLLIVPATFAAGETFKVISIDAVGCASGDFDMTVERANLDGSSYTVNTIVTVGGLIYMNENASINLNGLSTWSIFDNFSYGAVSNPGTYPIPAGEEMRIDFRLEYPIGTVLYEWTLITPGCDSDTILYNGPTPSSVVAGGGCGLSIPSGSVVGEAPLGAQVYYEPGNEVPGVVLNPGTYTVTGQDASEMYYQVVLACQLVWVSKDAMQPSYLSPQNGQALPTNVVG